jgi:anti-sigma28 factor (negative regulator of flagellin synthesis)
MKIHDSGNVLRSHLQSQRTQASTGNVSDQKASGLSSASPAIETNSIEALTSLLVGGAEVRESLVQEIKLKIQTGEYLSQKAAVETADAILNL